MQPYLLALCQEKEKGFFARSVLTAVACIGPNKTLFVTCNHVLSHAGDLLILDENGVPLPKVKIAAISVDKPYLDLLFLLIDHNVPRDRIRISNVSMVAGIEIVHARNRFDETEMSSPFTTHSALVKKSLFWAQCGWVEGGRRLTFGLLKSDDELQRARREGVFLYPILEMESWPGVSGSALWDKFGMIHGMVCGGDSKESRQKDGVPHLVYISAKIILREMNLVLKSQVFRDLVKEE